MSKKLKKVAKSYLNAINEMIVAIINGVMDNAYNIATLIEAAYPLILLSIYVGDLTYGAIVGSLGMFAILKVVKMSLNDSGAGSEVPVPRKRLTNYLGNGEYYIEDKDVPEAIIFLAEVEDYLTRMGKMSGMK